MEKQFDEMNVNALALADDDLTHIAETAHLTAAQHRRITAKALQKAGIAETKPKPIHYKKKIRLASVIIAAVVAAGALGIGVSGWLTYNKPLIESYFGTIGDERLLALELPDPVTVSNGKVKATVEACLHDRYKMLVLITFDSDEGFDHKIDWFKQMKPNYPDECFYYHVDVLDENGEPTWTEDNPGGSIRISKGAWAATPENGAITVETELQIETPDYDAETLMLRFSNEEYGTLDVPVTVTPCLETLSLVSEDGTRMYLSPLGLRTEPNILPYGDEYRYLTLNRSDGTQSSGYLDHIGGEGYSGPDGHYSHCEAMIYEVTEGMEYDHKNPATYNGFVDISNVISVEWGGVLYTLTE